MRKLRRVLQRRGRRQTFTGSPAIPSGRLKKALTAGRLASNEATRGPDNADEAIAENCPELVRMDRRRPRSDHGGGPARRDLRRDPPAFRSPSPQPCLWTGG